MAIMAQARIPQVGNASPTSALMVVQIVAMNTSAAPI
jgi:hypothetical protein